MKRYIISAEYRGLGPRQGKELDQLIQAYNSLQVKESIDTSVTLGRYLDSYLRDHGLVCNKDFMAYPFREGCIIKLSNKTV